MDHTTTRMTTNPTRTVPNPTLTTAINLTLATAINLTLPTMDRTCPTTTIHMVDMKKKSICNNRHVHASNTLQKTAFFNAIDCSEGYGGYGGYGGYNGGYGGYHYREAEADISYDYIGIDECCEIPETDAGLHLSLNMFKVWNPLSVFQSHFCRKLDCSRSKLMKLHKYFKIESLDHG